MENPLQFFAGLHQPLLVRTPTIFLLQKRNRDFEYNIKLEYLRTLNEHYETWIGQYKLGKLLIIDVNNMDFVERVEDFSTIVGRLELELNNLFGD